MYDVNIIQDTHVLCSGGLVGWQSYNLMISEYKWTTSQRGVLIYYINRLSAEYAPVNNAALPHCEITSTHTLVVDMDENQ